MAYGTVTDFVAGEGIDIDRLNQLIANESFLYNAVAGIAATAVPNWSFETDTNGDGVPDEWTWTNYTGGTITRSSAQQHSGGYCAAIVHPGGGGNGGGYLTSSSYIAVGKSEQRVLSFALKCSAAGMECRAEIIWYTSALAVSRTDTAYSSTSNPTSWEVEKYFVESPSDAVWAKIKLYGGKDTTSTGGTAYFDSVLFAAVASAPTVKMQVFTTTGANSWTVPSGVTRVYITAVAGGGGGSGCAYKTSNVGAGGGGAGGFGVRREPYAVTPGATLTITIGTGGSAGAAQFDGTSGAGGAGGTTSISGGVAGTITLQGGGGGGTATVTNGGSGGSQPGNNKHHSSGMGDGGTGGSQVTSGAIAGGDGGPSILGTCGVGASNAVGAAPLWGYGGGGSGGGGNASLNSGYAGGVGAQGVAIVEWL